MTMTQSYEENIKVLLYRIFAKGKANEESYKEEQDQIMDCVDKIKKGEEFS